MLATIGLDLGGGGQFCPPPPAFRRNRAVSAWK